MDIKIRVLFIIHNHDFSPEIKEHYTTVDRLMNGSDSFDYITGPEIVAKNQFTGSFDSNSKEMYVDDICKVDGLGFCRVALCQLYGVVFHDKHGQEARLLDCLFEGDSFYVVGNEHQNPELIEDV